MNSTITLQDLRKTSSALAHDGNADKVKAALSICDAEKLQQLQKDDYPLFMAMLQRAGGN